MSYIPIAGTISPWIPCSERLPRRTDRVLVYTGGGQFLVCDYDKYGWWHETSECDVYGVTHWMPLPTAPVPAEVITA